MKKMYDITFTPKSYKSCLFTYPCVDSNTAFLKGKKLAVFGSNMIGEEIIKYAERKGAVIQNSIYDDPDILIINTMPPPRARPREGKQHIYLEHKQRYFDVLFHYIRPVQKILPCMLKKETGNIVFVLPPNAVTPSVEYYRMGVFAVIGLIKGLALQYAPQGIVINGIVLGEQKMYQAIAEWVIFLASGNSRNIIGELIILD